MSVAFKSTREVILRMDKWADAVRFYGSVLGLPVAYQAETLVGFETGAFRLYVEKGKAHGPVFELLAPDMQAAKERLIGEGCTIVEEDATLPRCYIQDPFGFVFNLGQASTSE